MLKTNQSDQTTLIQSKLDCFGWIGLVSKMLKSDPICTVNTHTENHLVLQQLLDNCLGLSSYVSGG